MTDELLSAKREKYPVNKGIGRPVEFKGLKAKYGEHGLMKLGAARMRPRYLIHRRRVSHLLRRKKKGGKT